MKAELEDADSTLSSLTGSTLSSLTGSIFILGVDIILDYINGRHDSIYLSEEVRLKITDHSTNEIVSVKMND